MAARKTLLDRPVESSRRDRTERRRPSSRPAELDDATKEQIYRRWRRGVSAGFLAEQFGSSTAAIDRVINELRAQRVLGQKLGFIYDPSFDDPKSTEAILGPVPAPVGKGKSTAKGRPPAGLPPYLASMYIDGPLLNREQEAHLFRKMNYLKYRASVLRERLVPERAEASDVDEIERLQEQALAVKNQIIRANLRLVVSIAKKRVGPSNDFFELVSDGNMSLINAVENFDFSRGFKFSTYASWAIMKNFARTIPEEKTRRDRFVTGLDEMFESAADHRADEYESERNHRRNRELIQGMLGRLSDRERLILTSRYGLDGGNTSTLEEIGNELGVTKERVRQIVTRAQEKLRKFSGT
jgi:RNA polymerase primary sigma factor